METFLPPVTTTWTGGGLSMSKGPQSARRALGVCDAIQDSSYFDCPGGGWRLETPSGAACRE
jgi:hypothetical protein